MRFSVILLIFSAIRAARAIPRSNSGIRQSTTRQSRSTSLDGYVYPSPSIPFPSPTPGTTKKPSKCRQYLPPQEDCGGQSIIKIMPKYISKSVQIPHFLPKEISTYKFVPMKIPFPEFEMQEVQEEEADYLPVMEWDNYTLKFDSKEVVARSPDNILKMVQQDRFQFVIGETFYNDTVISENDTTIETILEEQLDEEVIEIRPIKELEEIQIPVHYVVYNDTEVEVIEEVTEYFNVTVHKVNYTKNAFVIRSVTVETKDYTQIDYKLQVLEPVEIDHVEDEKPEVEVPIVNLVSDIVPIKRLTWKEAIEVEVPTFETKDYQVPKLKMYDVNVPEFVPNPVILPKYIKKSCTLKKISDTYLPPDCKCPTCKTCPICPPHGDDEGYNYNPPLEHHSRLDLEPPRYEYPDVE